MGRALASYSFCLLALLSGARAVADEFEAVRVWPDQIQLNGEGDQKGLQVEGRRGDVWVDLTTTARYRAPQAIAQVDRNGVVHSRSDGEGEVQIAVAGRTLTVPLTVRDSERQRRIDFESDVTPVLSKYGCNASGCHGKAEGQNGFKLSVFGFDPPADHRALTQESRGRRISIAAPSTSLLLTKATGAVPHGGGARIPSGSDAYRTLLQWIAQGAAAQSGVASPLLKLTVRPRQRVIAMNGKQQLRAIATYADGREEDVTRITKFATNNPALATVSEGGMVGVRDVPGQAAIMASFMGKVDRLEVLIPRSGEAIDPGERETHPFDRAIQRRLTQLNIEPAPLTDDATFLRRATLDIIGALPTTEETRSFLADKDLAKRQKLIDRLLERPEYADYWALKWSDLLRVDRRALGHKKAYAYYRWIHQQFANNSPIDQFTRDVVTAAGPLRDAPQGHFYSAVAGAGKQASTLSQVFLGVRIACAECHHHPFDRWSQKDYLGMSGYFVSLKRGSSIRGEAMFAANSPAQMKHPRTGEMVPAHPLGQASADNKTEKGEQRDQLAQWMTDPENPWFARAIANRYWAHFLGRGVVEPVDDFRDTNPPTNPELLDALAESLTTNDFDLKALIRAITVSKAYQRATDVNHSNRRDEQNFSRRLFKRLEAEVLFDAVLQVTGGEEKFEGVPYGSRAVQLWDSETPHYFLKQFGRPMRKTSCECERISSPNVGQVLHLLNSEELANKIAHADGRAAKLAAEFTDAETLATELYLLMFSRQPTENELRSASKHLRSDAQSRQENVEDLMWALMNSIEFVFNH